MKTFKRIVTIVLSLAYVVFLVLCASSLSMRMGSTAASTDSGKKTTAVSKPVSAGAPTVDFAAGSFPEDAEELTLVLQEGETALLDRFLTDLDG